MVPPGHSNLWVFSVNFDIFFSTSLWRYPWEEFIGTLVFILHLYCFLVINSASCLTIRIRTGSSIDRRTTNILTHTNHILVMSRIRINATDPILRLMGILIPVFQSWAQYWRLLVQILNPSKNSHSQQHSNKKFNYKVTDPRIWSDEIWDIRTPSENWWSRAIPSKKMSQVFRDTWTC